MLRTTRPLRLAELFKSKGFDGIAYRSSLGPGHNLALFDLTLAKQVNCFLFEAKKVSIEFDEAGRPYSLSEIGMKKRSRLGRIRNHP